MKVLVLTVMNFFWLLLVFYSVLTLAGLWFRVRYQPPPKLTHDPSVAVLIPAHNEGVVIEETLRAMARLQYSGQMDIYLLDDNSSDDTGHIAKQFSAVFSHMHYIRVPPGEPKGKSRVLNYGLRMTQSDYFVVYDADNQPEPDAVEKLVETAETTTGAAGAVGYVKTINADKNSLTGMIALEFQVFQLLMQCGRWTLFKLGTLTGTNMLLKRSLVEQLDGYDEYALAEDAELTVRLTAGYLLPIVPVARTWEQEPEQVRVFMRQRTRWLTGNLYLLEKSLHDLTHWRGRSFLLTMQHLLTYLVFVLLLLVSDVVFMMGVFGFVWLDLRIPLLILWFMSYVVYTGQLLSALVIDRTVSLKNVLYVVIMYFTYAQLFIILFVRSVSSYIWNRLRGRTIGWDKTQRFRNRERGDGDK